MKFNFLLSSAGSLLLLFHLVPLSAGDTYTRFNRKLGNAIQNNNVRDLKKFLKEASKKNYSILTKSDEQIAPGNFDINVKDSNGYTLLHNICCAFYGYRNAVIRISLERILRYGADPTIPNASGYSAIYYATLSAIHLDKDKFIPLIETLVQNSCVDRECLEKKDNSGYTPLHHCAHYRGTISKEVASEDVAQVLIRLGANIDAEDNNGQTPLQVAEEFLPEKTPVYRLLNDLKEGNAPRWYKNIDC